MSPATASRRRAIRRLLASGPVTSQQQIVAALKTAGHDVTQATVSRDLEAIGAHKVREGQEPARYVVAEDRSPFGDDNRAAARAIADFVESIAASRDLVVLKTPPGAAHLVAGAIDHSVIGGVLGTIAGDDTLLVVADTTAGAATVAKRLEELGGYRT